MGDYDYPDIERFYKELGWWLGESEVVDLDWDRQVRDFVMHMDMVRPAVDERTATVKGLGFDRAMAGRLIFESAAHVAINRPQHIALTVERPGPAWFTVVAVWRNQPLPAGRTDLEGDWQSYSIFADDGQRFPSIAVVCKSCRFEPSRTE